MKNMPFRVSWKPHNIRGAFVWKQALGERGVRVEIRKEDRPFNFPDFKKGF